VMN
jgi:hypothetical protein